MRSVTLSDLPKRVRLNQLRQHLEAASGRTWTHHELVAFLDEYHVELIRTQGQPNTGFAAIRPELGTAAVTRADARNLIAHVQVTSRPEAD